MTDNLVEDYLEKEHENSLSSSRLDPLEVGELIEICFPLNSFKNVKNRFKLFKDLWSLKLDYNEISGSIDLRQLISQQYDSISPENIFVTAGPQEAISISLDSILSSEDHVIYQEPIYGSLYEIPTDIGCKLSKISPKENQWDIELEDITESIEDNTKLIILNSPNNPTGHVHTEEFYEKLIEIAKKKGIYILVDEVHRGLLYNDNKSTKSIMDYDYEKVISISGLSKTMALPGIRIGWIASKDDNFLKNCYAKKQITSYSNSTLDSYFTELALEHRETILKKNKTIVQENLEHFRIFAEKYNQLFEYTPPDGGNVGFVKINVEEGAEKFCEKFLDETKILIEHSKLYKFGNEHIRIGFGRKNFPALLQKLDKYIEKNYI
ncbi:aminotransferase class I/II-fold pyridoxal phosphate-dependent enzyme [archaeon]|nr:aminotransferase class I/II-fold pyridoxal phosphate-dependent enzyme [archaeon]